MLARKTATIIIEMLSGFWITANKASSYCNSFFIRGFCFSHFFHRHIPEQNFCHFLFWRKRFPHSLHLICGLPFPAYDELLFNIRPLFIKRFEKDSRRYQITSLTRRIKIRFLVCSAMNYWKDMIITIRPFLKAITARNEFSKFGAVNTSSVLHSLSIQRVETRFYVFLGGNCVTT